MKAFLDGRKASLTVNTRGSPSDCLWPCAFGATVGREAALAELVAERDIWCGRADCTSMPPDLLIRADAMAPASVLPALLRDLGALGFGTASLAVVPQ